MRSFSVLAFACLLISCQPKSDPANDQVPSDAVSGKPTATESSADPPLGKPEPDKAETGLQFDTITKEAIVAKESLPTSASLDPEPPTLSSSQQVEQEPEAAEEKPSKEIKEVANPDHSMWDDLLRKNVSAEGRVNYRGFKNDRTLLDQYLHYLQENPLQASWSRNERLTYWINAYNAFTVDLILQHYPLKSIMDLEKPWDQKFITLGDKKYSLNQIEHQIVRPQFREPRIHFALVCAAVSCPKLLNRSYRPEQLNQQLENQTRYFLNSSGKNKLSAQKVEVSQLFNWYGEDFTAEGSIVDFLNRYADIKIAANAEVIFAEYDWALNE